ncbi:MAG TPA: OmpH family outer membrane protein [Pyrinomonadaceae bacterium]|nr:OmpH family outer membrane protein [Pyrinomonadaceae bacterium]
MKTFRLIAAGFFFAVVFAVSGYAQAGAAQPAGTAKIVVIDTGAFANEKAGGITKYVNAMKSLDTEFTPVQTDLQNTATRIQTLQKEIQTLQDQAAGGKVPVDPKTAQAKVDSFQLLQTDFKRKQEDAKVKFERRQDQIMGPVMQDIFKAMQDFAKLKGYDLILDAVKLDAQQMILAFIPSKLDVTKEFITFYNGRGAGTASAATP